MTDRVLPRRDVRGGAFALVGGGAALLALAACVHGPPATLDGRPSTPATPNQIWTPPPSAVAPITAPKAALPAGLSPDTASRLTLPEVVDLALRNNTATRLSWAQARAAAAAVGAQRGAYFPTITLGASVTRSKSIATNNFFGGERTQYGPTATLSYLLLDFGGRGGAVEAAKQTAFAADFTHNATLEDVVLQVEGAYFTYMSTRALLAAEQATVEEAAANLQAANERHRVGLATIADVLQAQTALSQAQLALETTQGDLQAARGALAVAMGLPANAPYDLQAQPQSIPVAAIGESVDSLIAQAVRARPDFAAARASVRAAQAQERVTRAQGYPAITLNGTAGQTYSNVRTFAGNSYSVTVGLQFPLFTGFTHSYDVVAAQAQVEAAAARSEALRQQIVDQVFTSYYALQTATRRVSTADALLSSATQSEQVALGRYRAGVGSIIDLLTAQSALANARAQQVQSRWTWATSLAQLAHDAGVLGANGMAPIPLSTDTTRRAPQ